MRIVGDALPQGALDGVDLADAVQLVAGQIQEHEAVGAESARDPRNVEFVALEDDVARIPPAEQRGDDAGVHVVAALVGDHVEPGPERGDEHAGGGGFTVGTGDQGDGTAFTEPLHDRGIDGAGDETADHAACTAPGGP